MSLIANLQPLQQWQSWPVAEGKITAQNLAGFKQLQAEYLADQDSLTAAALLALHADSIAMAFVAGYQMAIRYLDASCPADVLAALLVSESGVKQPWHMTTEITECSGKLLLNGEKSYAMLMGEGLEQLYVLAKQDEHLVCVRSSAAAQGVNAIMKPAAKFFPEIPHNAVSFQDVEVAVQSYISRDAHNEVNKPFRYFEDMHVAIALLAWASKQVSEVSQQKLLQQASLLAEELCISPKYYSLNGIAVIDQAVDLLDEVGAEFSSQVQQDWQRDRMMLLFAKQLRVKIKAKLQSA